MLSTCASSLQATTGASRLVASLQLLRECPGLALHYYRAASSARGVGLHPGQPSAATPAAANLQSQRSWLSGAGLGPQSGAAAAHLHHAAVADASSSDEDTSSGSQQASSSQHAARSPTAASWLDQQRLNRHLNHQQQKLHHMAAHQPPPQSAANQPQQHHQPRYQGHLHAPHGRRHATSRSSIDRLISEQLLSCKSLGMLRRIMIRHKSTMEPEHVADTLLCLQHLVRAARYAKRAGVRPGAPFVHHATSQARSQPRVRAAGELSRSRVRSSESDGHTEQLMAQMLGELGSMIWFMMGDMTGPDLAKCLYSWAALEWHPEPELLADVKASFISAAAGGGLQQQGGAQQQEQQQQQEPGQQQWAELELWQGPWMAAGLWGLLKLGEPCEGRVLQLLSQYWQQLVRYWTPQQLADVAAAVSLTADEQVAQAVTAGGSAAADGGQALQEELQLVGLVLGLSRHLLAVLAQARQGAADGAEPLVPLPWPESMLIQVQTSVLSAGVPAAQRAAAAVNEIAAAGASSPAGAAVPSGAPMMAVSNMPQLAWRMLQALAAVGVNVSEPADEAVGAVIADLSEVTKMTVGRA